MLNSKQRKEFDQLKAIQQFKAHSPQGIDLNIEKKVTRNRRKAFKNRRPANWSKVFYSASFRVAFFARHDEVSGACHSREGQILALV